METENKYVVMVGNPVDGFSFYGPFENYESAINWADFGDGKGKLEMDWWIVDVEAV